MKNQLLFLNHNPQFYTTNTTEKNAFGLENYGLAGAKIIYRLTIFCSASLSCMIITGGE